MVARLGLNASGNGTHLNKSLIQVRQSKRRLAFAFLSRPCFSSFSLLLHFYYRRRIAIFINRLDKETITNKVKAITPSDQILQHTSIADQVLPTFQSSSLPVSASQ